MIRTQSIGRAALRRGLSTGPAWETLRVERSPEEERILTVSFNRPDSLNALNTLMGEELRDLFDADRMDAAYPGTSAVVLSGSERAFCVGADLKERKGMTDEVWAAQHRLFQKAALNILHCPVPVISAVEGASVCVCVSVSVYVRECALGRAR